MIRRSKLPGSIAVSLVGVFALLVIVGIRLRSLEEIHEPADVPGMPPGSAAMRATINPETGELEVRAGAPPLTLDPATSEAMRRDSEGLEEIHHPDGSVSVNLKGRFQSATVASFGEDGRIVICTEHDEDAESVLQGAAPTSTGQAELQ